MNFVKVDRAHKYGFTRKLAAEVLDLSSDEADVLLKESGYEKQSEQL